MKILVVEDNKRLASFLVRAFTEEGYTVDQVGDGQSAVQQISVIPYDLVVLDRMLPGLEGLIVCKQVRERGNNVPILVLTARNEVGERIEGLDTGADDYLAKPFDLGELLARARALLRRGAGDPILRVGPLVINRAQRWVQIGDRQVELTAREVALLEHLARAAGRDVPRMELLAKVWQANFDPASNVVDVQVKSLRDKLGDNGKMIETVRGVGYRLVVETSEPTSGD